MRVKYVPNYLIILYVLHYILITHFAPALIHVFPKLNYVSKQLFCIISGVKYSLRVFGECVSLNSY